MAAVEPIRYILRFPAPHTHYVAVEASFPTRGEDLTELTMAVWTPGSYLVREYARNVEGVAARGDDDRPLAVRKTRKNRWEVDTAGLTRFTFRYRLYCRDMSVRGNWVDDDFAMLNGAPTFVTLHDDDAGHEGAKRPHEVVLELPADWKRSICVLDNIQGSDENAFSAPDFDTLVDSPIIAGSPAVYEFEVGGREHLLVNQGEEGVWDGPCSARDVAKIVREQQDLWREIPYDRYVFFNLITEAGGGLEHKNSTVLMTSRWKSRIRDSYLDWLGLVSHEFFHTWNVKRLRPIELGPFDYEEEVYTRSLWIAEGITNYYTDLLVCRTGLSTRKEYLKSLSKLIERLQTTPGRFYTTLEESSFDAWIKLYRPDENTQNTTVSYYVKGAVVAFLLDVKIRRATDGARSLDDVLRVAYERFSGARGFRSDEFREVSSEVAETDLIRWFDEVLCTSRELDYAEALEWFGLRFRPRVDRGEKADRSDSDADVVADSATSDAWIGIETKNDSGRVVVTRVRRGTPAHEHGLDAKDEIIAIDGFRVSPSGLKERMRQYAPGDRVRLLVSRREKVLDLQLTLGERDSATWRLEVDRDADEKQKEHLALWLEPSGARKRD